MSKVIAGDIGGTKTLLQYVDLDLATSKYQVLFEKRYASGEFSAFNLILDDFVETLRSQSQINIDSTKACFAIAGPINKDGKKQTAKVTNLTWTLDNQELKSSFSFASVELINDFEAIAHGLATLQSSDLVSLQQGHRKQNAPKLILGAGTGLGVCQIVYHADGYTVLPSEGGHCDFAPGNEAQIELLRFLLTKYPHLSYDRLLSGLGIHNIFSFLAHREALENGDFVQSVNQAEDPAAAISQAMNSQPLAQQAIDIFVEIYGTQAGNFALSSLPYGGVYLAGGIAPKLIEQLQRPHFLEAFKAKGRMSSLMENFPIEVIMNTQIGVRGAAVIAHNA